MKRKLLKKLIRHNMSFMKTDKGWELALNPEPIVIKDEKVIKYLKKELTK